MNTRKREHLTRRKNSVAAALVALIVLILPMISALPMSSSQREQRVLAEEAPPPSGDVIVVLKDDSASRSAAASAADAGVEPTMVFSGVVDGYAASVTPEEAAALADDPRVSGIFPDLPVTIAAQTIPAGVKRVGTTSNSLASIDGVASTWGVDVAVIDTGVSQVDGQLRIAGGYDCTNSGTYADEHGHGTHVAGTIAAKDDAASVVGVAPGARIRAVKVLDASGGGSISSVICGLQWVYDNRTVVDVVNMSLVSSAAASENVGECASHPMHTLICSIVQAGIPVVVAAGNAARSVDSRSCTAPSGPCSQTEVVPAAYPEVITVSAFTDYDGLPGGGGTSNCSSMSDDRFAGSYSNYGASVDIMAPGTCVDSLALGGGIARMTGTSMATPHVAGAIALYKHANPTGTAAAARSWLIGKAQAQTSVRGILGGSPSDGNAEPVLWIGSALPPTLTPTATQVVTAAGQLYPFAGSSASAGSASSGFVRDNKPSTKWGTITSSNPDPANAWVQVQLSGNRPISQIRWMFGSIGNADSYRIQISADGNSWTTLKTRGNATKANVWQTLNPAAGTKARYIRFYFSNLNNDRWIGGISEIQVFGPLPATATPTRTSTPSVTATPIAPTFTATAMPTTTSTVTPTQTATESPTETAVPPTNTPIPTATPSPTESPTPIPLTETPTEMPTP